MSETPSQLWRVVWEGEFLSFQGTQILRKTEIFFTRDEAEDFVRKHEQAGHEVISCKQYVQMTGYDFDVFTGAEIASDKKQEDRHE